MSSKPKKPPIDKKSVRARLERAQQEVLFARIRRWIPNSDVVDGFVLEVRRTWVMLARLSDQVTLNGWALVRLKDIQAVVLDPDDGSFPAKVLKAREEWPPAFPEVSIDLENVASAIRAAAAAGPLLTVHAEFSRPDACWIGIPMSTKHERLKLRDLGVGGQWLPKPRKFDLDDITLLEFGGGYEDALYLVAGEAPPT